LSLSTPGSLFKTIIGNQDVLTQL